MKLHQVLTGAANTFDDKAAIAVGSVEDYPFTVILKLEASLSLYRLFTCISKFTIGFYFYVQNVQRIIVLTLGYIRGDSLVVI